VEDPTYIILINLQLFLKRRSWEFQPISNKNCT